MKPSPSTTSPALGGDRAAAHLVALDDLGDVAHPDRHAVDGAARRSLDVARLVTSPTPWTSVASPARSRLPPPTLALLRSSASASVVERQAAWRRAPAGRRRRGTAARRRPTR
jgi:hypothetical protein